MPMKLNGLNISDAEYYEKAAKIKQEMETLMEKDYAHLGVKQIQQIFIDQRERMYQWVKYREVPTENNRAERELRPTVIARKVSFGSQSPAVAKTRSAITSLLYTVKKRLKTESLEEWLAQTLNKNARHPTLKNATLIPPPPS